ncbi:Uncharacterized membrane protein [Seinonella peptonophila]|uniref:Uncharacterized membrane protein n=1 Tax=Seinonella peptonophila TaxID=112248 RepID=A0A1M4X230_9BACL|nr:anthrone oxygenase family protein [Seinonella peptonophila]SHE87544.1 Uncharacterized membrane protein [Seinonella peptonophila]
MMINDFILGITLYSLLGSGLMAGIFFAFSSFVMKSLASLPTNKGIAVMQTINIKILNPSFLFLFLGTSFTSLILIICSFFRWSEANTIYLFLGSLLYLIGGFIVTALFNVPLNNKLAVVDASSSADVKIWKDYLTIWTRWNHVRTVTCIAAMVMYILALR